MVSTLMPWLEAYGRQLRRFDYCKQDPHIDLELWTTELLRGSSGAVLGDLKTALLGDELG